jgi:hypothetical protein
MRFAFIRRRVSNWRFKEWNIGLTKRQEFVVISLVLTAGLILTQLIPEYRYQMTVVLSILTYLGSALVLRRDLKGIEYITLLTLPTLFTSAVTLFYFLLPTRWITRIPIASLYIFGMYALLLTENIYNVAAERSIALLRAAHTVGFLLTLITYFLLLSTVFALRENSFFTTGLILIITAPLVFQILWAIELSEKASGRLTHLTIVLTALFTQFAWVLTFWPVKTTIKALLLTTIFYSVAGLAQQYLVERMYRKTIIEFASVSIVVGIIFVITTNWYSIL